MFWYDDDPSGNFQITLLFVLRLIWLSDIIQIKIRIFFGNSLNKLAKQTKNLQIDSDGLVI